jgi:hypothetical protein
MPFRVDYRQTLETALAPTTFRCIAVANSDHGARLSWCRAQQGNGLELFCDLAVPIDRPLNLMGKLRTEGLQSVGYRR